MSKLLKDDLFWLAILPWAIFIGTNIARIADRTVVYLCAGIAVVAFVRAAYRVSKKADPLAWIAAVASLIAALWLGLIIFVVTGLL